MISLPALIERASRLNPDGVATRYRDRQHHWTELESRIARLGAALSKLPFDEADR
ncbi:MAG: acyl-CoA synthetase (AMP-forming)/AMP-acid ligase II, partial [Arenicella sp.]